MSATFMEQSVLDGATVDDEQLSLLKGGVRDYYASQNTQVQLYHDALQHHHRHAEQASREEDMQAASDRRSRDEAKVEFVVKLSFYLTFLILALKAYTSARTGSIAVISICVDSGLDLLSQFIMLMSTRLIRKVDLHNYPSGKSRMEPTGVVVFSCIMGMSAVVLLVESVQTLAADLSGTREKVFIDAISISLIGVVVAIQFSEYLYAKFVSKQTNNNASVNAIATDHLNDVVINGIGGIPAICAGYFPAYGWLDPVGGILLSLYIMYRWASTAIEMIPALIGKTADRQVIGQLTYLACIHSPQIRRIDTVMAYYSGPRLQVEIHIVLPDNMPLREAHDIGESLESAIEELDTVEMAFVHLDYETSHKPEHGRGKKVAAKDAKAEGEDMTNEQSEESQSRHSHSREGPEHVAIEMSTLDSEIKSRS